MWAGRSAWHDRHVGIVDGNVDEKVLERFKGFLLLNMRLEPRTVKATMQDVKRFLVK
ncbi:MAG TPA: hypothetical protein VMT42_00910 [candidate division Zixibacteria bacterium]|nr:hypothetical protein [candidate division Zixibacteria bacterium]